MSNDIIEVITPNELGEAMIKYRQGLGILGMIFAILGGVAWFIQQNILAIILWGFAGLILLKLNKRNRNIRSHQTR